MIFKGLSMKQITQFFLEGESLPLNVLFIFLIIVVPLEPAKGNSNE